MKSRLSPKYVTVLLLIIAGAVLSATNARNRHLSALNHNITTERLHSFLQGIFHWRLWEV